MFLFLSKKLYSRQYKIIIEVLVITQKKKKTQNSECAKKDYYDDERSGVVCLEKNMLLKRLVRGF